jgi:hypothetical protein
VRAFSYSHTLPCPIRSITTSHDRPEKIVTPARKMASRSTVAPMKLKAETRPEPTELPSQPPLANGMPVLACAKCSPASPQAPSSARMKPPLTIRRWPQPTVSGSLRCR